MHVFLITYEFTYSPFSGNGILARSIVKSLLLLGCHLTVVCRRPSLMHSDGDGGTAEEQHNNHLEIPELTDEQAKRLELISLPLSKNQSWKRLDRGSAWEDFTYESFVSSELGEDVTMAFDNADVTMAIDWTGAHAWRSFPSDSQKPFLYLNFRVYKSGGIENDSSTSSSWYDDMEKKALADADGIVALSTADQQSLLNLLDDDGQQRKQRSVDILWPPLRGEVADLATTTTTAPQDLDKYLPSVLQNVDFSTHPRRFITCIVRLSPEKNAMWFANTFLEALRTMEQADDDEDEWMIPVLAGAASDKEYAAQVRDSVRTIYPRTILLEEFLSPKALAAILSRTILNVHPCRYDAYGMTILEAAAMGAPSLISSSGNVGATALLGEESCYVPFAITTDNDNNGTTTSVAQIREIVRDTTKLEQIGQNAKEKALSWNETAYGKRLLGLIEDVAETKRNGEMSAEL